jgi:hypothetical protein
MSVAALEAVGLRRLLGDASNGSLEKLASSFFAEAASVIETPWAGAAIPDFIHPATRGKRPENFEASIKFGFALSKLAARDPAVHKLTAEVQNLLRPRSVYRDPELVQRVLAVLAEEHPS